MPTNLVNHNQVNHYIKKDSRKKEERNKVPRSLFKLKKSQRSVQEDPELTSFYKLTKSLATYGSFLFEKHLKT